MLRLGRPDPLLQTLLDHHQVRPRSQYQIVTGADEPMAAIDLFAERKRLPGPRHGHVEEPPLVVGTITPSVAVENQNMIELESFGPMRGQQHQWAVGPKCAAAA